MASCVGAGTDSAIILSKNPTGCDPDLEQCQRCLCRTMELSEGQKYFFASARDTVPSFNSTRAQSAFAALTWCACAVSGEAEALRAAGVNMIGIGITEEVDVDFLRQMSSPPQVESAASVPTASVLSRDIHPVHSHSRFAPRRMR